MNHWPNVTPAGIAVLQVLAQQRGPISRAALALKLGKTRADTNEIVRQLIDSGHAREVPRPYERANLAPLIALAKEATSVPAPAPKRMPMRAPRAGDALPLAMPPVPPAFARLRGIQHPQPPQAYEAAKGESKARWDFLTTIKVQQYE